MANLTADRPTLGPIDHNTTYPLPTFMALTGLSDWALRMARRRGLKMRTVGNRKFVRGCDWNAYLESVEG